MSAARAEFAAQTPLVRVLFDNGAGSGRTRGDPVDVLGRLRQLATRGHRREALLRPTRCPGHRASRQSDGHHLHPGPGGASPDQPARQSGNAWAADPGWDWTTVPSTDGIAFQTAPFTSATTIVGPATLDLWVRSTTPVEDFQATITEVRPSAGQEEYVTSGFLRSSNQVDLSDSTGLFTDPNYTAGEAQSLEPRAYRLVRIPIDPIVHTFRPGTELRVVISAPGGDRPIWEFDTLDDGQSATVGLGGAAASALVVNTVSGVSATPTLPVCGSLRGEPCRAYQAEGNQSGS